MSKRANPTIVGGFILGAIALLLVGLIVFGGGSFFRQRPRAVVFFQGNIQGLNVGAPVTLRGVRVGTVTAVRIEVDVEKNSVIIPVYMEFDPKLMSLKNMNISAADLRRQTVLRNAIDQGLHARLALQSFVTGQLLIDLSIDPAEPRRLVGADPETVEIPTSPSDIEKVKDVLARLPVEKITDAILRAAESLDRLVASSDVPTLVQSLISTANSINALTATTPKVLDSVSADIAKTAESARSALASAEVTLAEARTALRTSNRIMADDVKGALDAATAAMASAESALSNANKVMMSSRQRQDVDQTLRNLSATSRALRALADELERRPNAVIIGK